MSIYRLKPWTSWATELAMVENDYKQKCDPKVKAVLGAKRLLLMERVAKSIDCQIPHCFQAMAKVFRLVGQAPKSNAFQPGIKAASMSEEQLMKDARF